MVLPPPRILDALPHRPPFLFLSAVSTLDPGRAGEAAWSVDGTEDFLAGHFPDRPIVPGLLIAEALAQLSGLVGFASAVPVEARLAQVDVRFKVAVVPPSEIFLRSRLVLQNDALCQFEVEARVGLRVVARGRLVLAGNPRGTLGSIDSDEAP